MSLRRQRYAICAPDPLIIPTRDGLLIGWFWTWYFDLSVRTMRTTDRANPYKFIPSGRRLRLGVWPSWLQNDAQQICIIRVHCLGGWNETHTCVIQICVHCCVVLFPAKSMVPLYSASLHRLRYPMFEFCLVFSDVCFSLYDHCSYFCPSISTFSRVFCVVLAPPAGHINACFFELCVAAL